MKSIAIFLIFILAPSLILAQGRGLSKVYQVEKNKFVTYKDQSVGLDEFFVKQKDVLGISDGSEFVLNKLVEGVNGLNHHRFDQVYRGVPILNTTYILHEKNGQVIGSNGSYLAEIDLCVEPSLDAEMAMSIALMDMNAKNYSWEYEGYEKPIPELAIIDQKYPGLSEFHILVYHVTLYSVMPLAQQEYFIDAHSGHILKKFDVLHEWTIPATAETKYYGTCDIITDSIAPGVYILKDETRGQGISTRNWNETNFINDSTHWVLTNEAQDEVALDAHWCAEKFYDLLFDDFSWYGLGNSGEALNSHVHYFGGFDIVNAFWDGTYAVFGDGDCLNGPLTTLEVVGHEFMHGVTQYTSNLIYQGESGAINESISDIFGKALERKEDFDNFSWYVGHSFHLVNGVRSFRSFEDPTEFHDHPDYYKGQIWHDNAGVHRNSSVGNHWFWGLVEGETGINEEGESYSINGISWEKALQIVFSCETNYLVENSDYNDFYNASVLAAEELFGTGAPEIEEVKQAWLAVGLPREDEVIDLSIEHGENIAAVCSGNEFYDAEFFVTNNGPEVYLPSMNASVELYMPNGDTFSLNLDMEIDVGETITIVFDDVLFLDEDQNTLMYVEIIFLDNNLTNNRDWLALRSTTLLTPDLLIDVAYIVTECSTNEFRLDVRIGNIGCILPEGSSYRIKVMDELGFELINQEEVLVVDWLPGSSLVFSFQLLNVNDASNFTLHISSDEDLNQLNNVFELYLPRFDPITSYYLNPFETDSALMQQIAVRPYYSNFEVGEWYGIIEWEDELQFAASRRTNSLVPQTFPLCPGDPNDIFEYYTSSLTIVSFCADLIELQDPILSFDLTQFRNENQEHFDDYPDGTAMLRLAWNGSHEFTEIIKGQEEGQRVYKEYPMPQGFVGEVTLEFFHRSGATLNNPNFLDYDVSLLDNLEISGRTTSTQDVDVRSVEVFPNPAEEIVYLSGIEDAKGINVYDSRGALVLTLQIPNTDGAEISLESIVNGYYFIEIEMKDGNRITKSFVRG